MAPVVVKSLSRLSRDSIIDLCMNWTDTSSATPYLTTNRNLHESEEEDYLHEPAENVTNLKKFYQSLKEQGNENGSLSKRDIIDRIVDGDWRRGLSLQQLADVDFAALEQNDTALRWSALKFVPFRSQENSTCTHPAKKRKISQSPVRQLHYPTTSPALFVANLKSHIAPLVKAHYTIHRLALPSDLVVIRLYIVPNSPFAPLSSNIPRNVRHATESSQVMYIALPNSCSYVYVSISGGNVSTTTAQTKDGKSASAAKLDMAATKRVILESIPKAMSKPQERWSLEHTKLTCRSLKAIGLLRGNGRPGTAGGCYSKFSEEYVWKPSAQTVISEPPSLNNAESVATAEQESNPLAILRPPTQQSEPQSAHSSLINTRFGNMTQSSHAKLDRFHVTINDLLAQPLTTKLTSQRQQPSRKSKRKRRSLEDIEAGRDEPVEVAPSKRDPAPITITFSGVDVFRGLKELALVDGGRYVDLDRLPAWMTGEKGVSGLVV